MIRKILLAGLAMALLSPLPAVASFYAGVGLGNVFIGDEVTDITNEVRTIDENSTSFKFFAGYASESFFGFEGGYRNLGKVDGYGDAPGSANATQTKGGVVLTNERDRVSFIDIFAKAGVFFYTTDTFVGTTPYYDSGGAFLWGLGAGVRLGPVGLRIEWESLEVSTPEDLSMASLGLTLGF